MKLVFTFILLIIFYLFYQFAQPKAPAPVPTPRPSHVKHESHFQAERTLTAAKHMLQSQLLDDAWQTLLQAGRGLSMDENTLTPAQLREGRQLRISILEEMVKVLQAQERNAQAQDSNQKQAIASRNQDLRHLQQRIANEQRLAQNSRIDIRRNQHLNELRSQEQDLMRQIRRMEQAHHSQTTTVLEGLKNQTQQLQHQLALEKAQL